MNDNRVGIICNGSYVKKSDIFIPTENRNSMVQALIDASGLMDKIIPIQSSPAHFDDLTLFHSMDYLLFLKEGHINSDEELAAEFGFGYDCPFRPGVYEYCRQIAGGSITAAKHLCQGNFDIIFHWLGGWHHAKRSEAAGYCYINDCVLAILQLRTCFPKVLYVDLDLHHGDGVQDAFCATNKVMTFSVHKYEPGFFPGSGALNETGLGKGHLFTVNLPLRDGIQDELFASSCKRVLQKMKEKFAPDAIVCQVGADGLNGDPMRSFNLTTKSLESCVNQITNWKLPTLILGGGGYHEANVARCWTKITASILREQLPDEIPDHDFFLKYGPDFEFSVEKSFKKDCNLTDDLNAAVDSIIFNLNKI